MNQKVTATDIIFAMRAPMSCLRVARNAPVFSKLLVTRAARNEPYAKPPATPNGRTSKGTTSLRVLLASRVIGSPKYTATSNAKRPATIIPKGAARVNCVSVLVL